MTVAVAHNDTPEASAALAAAAEEALRLGQDLVVLQALPGTESELSPAEETDLRAHLAAALGEFAGLQWDLHTIPDAGSPAAALLDLAAEASASLLVIGSRRRSPVGKLLLGSTVQRILLDAPMPVLVVKVPPEG